MTVATETRYEIGKTVGIHVNDLNFGLNARYGWGNGNILEAYKAKNEALKQKIEEWGFRKAHAVEAYYDDEGKLTVKHGNRRTFAAKWIHDEDPEAPIAWEDDMPIGHIWVTIVKKPDSVIELLEEQVADNEQLAATKLDTLMVYQARVDELIKSGEVKTANNAVKLIAKQDFKAKAERIVELGEATSIDDAYKSLKKELSAYEANLKKDLRVMSLSPQVLSWLQESYLDACDIKLSFGKINELLTTYGEKADLLLKEALQEVTLEPREEYSQNQYLSSKWLENLAKKLGLANEEKPPKKPAKPAPVVTSTVDDSDEEEGEELTLETQTEEEEGIAEEKPKNTKTSNIQTKAKKARDYYFLQAQKLLDSQVGLLIVDAELKATEDGLTEFKVIIPTTAAAKEFQLFIDNINAALGNAEAIAKLEAINPQPVAPEPVAEEWEEEQEETTNNPLDDVDLGDIEY